MPCAPPAVYVRSWLVPSPGGSSVPSSGGSVISKSTGSSKSSKHWSSTVRRPPVRTSTGSGVSQTGAAGATTSTEKVSVTVPPWPSLAT